MPRQTALLAILLSTLSTLYFHQAQAQQQQWSSQYVSWVFDSALDIDDLEQQVWVNNPNAASFWPLQFSWKEGGGEGGYMGLQQLDGQSPPSQIVRFSLWNATEASGNSCRPFGGEGIGYTCEMPITIDPSNFYRVRLERLNSDGVGQWRGGKLYELVNGVVIEHSVGQIKVPLAYNAIAPSSISNFVEYYGDAVAQCKDVPLSVVGFTPPSVNYRGGGVYGGYSTYGTSVPAAGNICVNGDESQGAFITAMPFDFGVSNGVMMFMGGIKAQHVFDSVANPTPAYLPDVSLIFRSGFELSEGNAAKARCEVDGNLVSNCAVTSDVQGWTADLGAIAHFAGDTRSGSAGAASLTVSSTDSLVTISQCVPVVGGATYSSFFSARELNIGEDWFCTMNIIENSNSACSTDDNIINGSVVDDLTTAWKVIQLPDVTMAPGTTHAYYDISCGNSNSVSANSLLIDDMTFGPSLTP